MSYDAMSNLPAELRASLSETLPMDPLKLVHAIETDDGETVKMLYTTHDGQLVETVLMFYRPGDRLCLGQVGCARSAARFARPDSGDCNAI
ncbi:MAG: hypothetical protein R2848_02970 [Thermomicrobiales bacterium]